MLSSKIKTVQSITSLAITGAITEIYKETLCQELSLESLKSRTWLRCMCYFFKLSITLRSVNLLNLRLVKIESPRHNSYLFLSCRKDYFKNSSAPYVAKTQSKLSTENWNSTSYQQFRKSLSEPTFVQYFYIQPCSCQIVSPIKF